MTKQTVDRGTTEQRWTRDDLGPRTADVTEHHTIRVRLDPNGYTRIHEDSLGPLLRSAGYQLQSSFRLANSYPTDPWANALDHTWSGLGPCPRCDPATGHNHCPA